MVGLYYVAEEEERDNAILAVSVHIIYITSPTPEAAAMYTTVALHIVRIFISLQWSPWPDVYMYMNIHTYTQTHIHTLSHTHTQRAVNLSRPTRD